MLSRMLNLSPIDYRGIFVIFVVADSCMPSTIKATVFVCVVSLQSANVSENCYMKIQQRALTSARHEGLLPLSPVTTSYWSFI